MLRERGHELVEVKKTPKEAELLTMIADFDGLIVRSGTDVNAAVIGAGKKLQLIGRAGVGVDNVDLAAATRAGVIVVRDDAHRARTALRAPHAALRRATAPAAPAGLRPWLEAAPVNVDAALAQHRAQRAKQPS